MPVNKEGLEGEEGSVAEVEMLSDLSKVRVYKVPLFHLKDRGLGVGCSLSVGEDIV